MPKTLILSVSMIHYNFFKSFKNLLLIFLLFGFFTSAFTQGLYDQKFYGPYITLYKLNNAQAEYAVHHPYKLDTAFLYTTKVGEVSTDSLIPLHQKQVGFYPIKPIYRGYNGWLKGRNNQIWNLIDNGYFIEVRVTGINQVDYKLIENAIFHSAIFRVGYETFVFVEDSAGLSVTDALVKLDTLTCTYDASIGGYHIPRNDISGTLKVQKGDIFTLKAVNGYSNNNNNGRPPHDDYNYAKRNVQGYLVSNKPVYRPGDTIFFKSFLVGKRAKPLKKKLIARLYQNQTGIAAEYAISPNPKGAYSGFFVVADSFRTDAPLGLTLLSQSRNSLILIELRTENYELKDIEFTLNQESYSVTPGNGNKIYATAINKAGLPLLDGTLSLKLSINDIDYAASDSFSITNAKMQQFYSISLLTDPTGITEFELPAHIFPDIKASYQGTIVLTTASNEVFEKYFYFSYETTKDIQKAYIEDDTFRVHRYYNALPVHRKMRIKIYSRYDLIVDSIFTTPLNLYLPPNISQVTIFKGDTQTGTYYRYVDIPEIQGKRTHDSVQIYFHSKSDVPVFYRIYKDNLLVKSGSDTALQYHAADRSSFSYHIQYGVLAGNVTQPKFYSKSFHLAEKELNVQIIQPDIIYPGQQVAVEIRVKNAFGKPVKKVNLTAWAVNTQLDGLVKPQLPFMGKIKDQKPLPLVPFVVSNFELHGSSVLKHWHLQQLKLHNNKVFNLVYPHKGFRVLHDTTPDSITQLAFFNHHYGQYSPVKYLKLNDSFVYIDKITPAPEIVKVNPGIYKLTARLAGRIITLNNVEIVKGQKNFICFNQDSLNYYNIGDTIVENKYTDEELTDILKHTLLFRFDYILNDTLIIQVNGETDKAFQQGRIGSDLTQIYTRKERFNSNTRGTEYENVQAFYSFGPINEKDIITVSWKNNYAHEFQIINGHTYSFTSKELVMQPMDDVKFGHQYFAKYENGVYGLNEFWWDPFKKSKQPEYQYYNQPRSEPQSALAEFNYSNYAPSAKTKTSFLHIYIPQEYYAKRIWIFNTGDSSLSYLQNYPNINNIPDAGLNSYKYLTVHSDFGKHTEYLVALQQNDTMWLVKTFNIDSSVNVYYTFKASDFRKLRSNEYFLFDRMAKILGRNPFENFEDTPTINQGINLITLPNKNGITKLEGTVNGPDLKYVVSNAFVILERNGYFVKGAITNSDGRFLMDSIQGGDYMLKIKSNDYHYWIHYSIKITQGKLHLLNVKMKPFSRFTYTLFDTDSDGMYASDYDGEEAYAASPSYYANSEDRAIGLATIQSASRKKNSFAGISYAISGNRGISARGSRADGNGTYIDGQRLVGGNFDLADQKSKSEELYEWDFGDISNADTTMLNSMAQNSAATKMRKFFQDYAYWIPNLTTDKNGFATYAVTFPDNITTWQTWVPAMDGKRHSGLGELKVKAYKPVSSSLALPWYLTEGDSLLVFGRINNYTGTQLKGKYTLFKDSQGIEKEVNIISSVKDSLLVNAGSAGKSILFENGFSMSNGYRDVQQRFINVLPASVTTGLSKLIHLKTDTSIRMSGLTGDFEQSIYIYSSEYGALLELLKKNVSKTYPDNQSLADLLNNLLMQKEFSDALGLRFENDKLIEETIKKLRNSQTPIGTFGWFRKGIADPNITAYIAEILFKADEMGYKNNAWLNIARYFENQLPYAYEGAALNALYILKRLNRNEDYEKYLIRINPKTLTYNEKLRYQLLLTLLGKKPDLTVVTHHFTASPQGNVYITGTDEHIYRYQPYCDQSTNTYMAWQLLLLNNAEKKARDVMADWMAYEASKTLRNNTRAVEMLGKKSNMIDLGLKKPEVLLNGAPLALNEYPKHVILKDTQTLTIDHKNSDVFVLQSRYFKTYNPTSDTTTLRIKHNLDSNKILKVGVYTSMEVQVFAKSNQRNVVVEIPIPAGCVVSHKIQNEHYFEAQREYDYDRVYIYLDEIPFGYQTFKLTLLPKFSGKFNIPPAKVALMHYPEISAFTAKNAVIIQ